MGDDVCEFPEGEPQCVTHDRWAYECAQAQSRAAANARGAVARLVEERDALRQERDVYARNLEDAQADLGHEADENARLVARVAALLTEREAYFRLGRDRGFFDAGLSSAVCKGCGHVNDPDGLDEAGFDRGYYILGGTVNEPWHKGCASRALAAPLAPPAAPAAPAAPEET